MMRLYLYLLGSQAYCFLFRRPLWTAWRSCLARALVRHLGLKACYHGGLEPAQVRLKISVPSSSSQISTQRVFLGTRYS